MGGVSFLAPGMLALNPQSNQLFVSRSMMAVSPPMSIGEIQRSDMSLREVEVQFQRPHAMVVDPSGDYAHSASLAENRILTLETNTDEVTFTAIAIYISICHISSSPWTLMYPPARHRGIRSIYLTVANTYYRVQEYLLRAGELW